MNPFDRSLRKYLSKALFVNSITSPSIGTDPLINNTSLYDFITLVLQLKGCCGGTTEEVLDDLKCPTCGASFKTKEELMKHGKTHVEDTAKDLKSKLKL